VILKTVRKTASKGNRCFCVEITFCCNAHTDLSMGRLLLDYMHRCLQSVLRTAKELAELLYSHWEFHGSINWEKDIAGLLACSGPANYQLCPC